jgi:hypothetical protein
VTLGLSLSKLFECSGHGTNPKWPFSSFRLKVAACEDALQLTTAIKVGEQWASTSTSFCWVMLDCAGSGSLFKNQMNELQTMQQALVFHRSDDTFAAPIHAFRSGLGAGQLQCAGCLER